MNTSPPIYTLKKANTNYNIIVKFNGLLKQF